MSFVVTGNNTNNENIQLFFSTVNWFLKKELHFVNLDMPRALEMAYCKWPFKQGSAGHVYRGLESAVMVMNSDRAAPDQRTQRPGGARGRRRVDHRRAPRGQSI
eukprot:TRINITY_DN26669_c0_g2_i1.p4 TRINITY_DN26669_c0_g2~~TRINITY_DN26669_c0_g2_i1.p4  ORF type:complete len:104 (+),score=20.73 TRINITY_DN26669_c0_g2_i1:525-836(+)